MPASADDTRSSAAANSVNGNVARKNPATDRCPHARREVGSL